MLAPSKHIPKAEKWPLGLEPFAISAVLGRMLPRHALASAVLLASCTQTPLPTPKAPDAQAAPTPPTQAPEPAAKAPAEPAPALSVEPLVPGDAARWRITNHTPEPLRLGLEHAQRYWARDCRSPLTRIGDDERARCMPIRIETDVPAYATLNPGATAVLTLSLEFSTTGPEPALPAGRYILSIPTTHPQTLTHGPTASVRFRLEGLDENEAKTLAERVAFANEHGCVQTSELGQRALAWTAPESITLAALHSPGVPWMRARYARFAVMLPEAQEHLRSALHGVTFDAAVAINALLAPRTQAPTEVREEALRALPSTLSVSGFDPILVQAVADSDLSGRILEAVAWRVQSREESELEVWESGLGCARARAGDEFALADLIHAFRARAKKAKPDLATLLRARADKLEEQLRERRDDINQALQIARAGRPPSGGPNTAPLFIGCGYSIRGIRPEPACTGAEIPANDPALRFLSAPMRLMVE